ncbi:hypothetical protein J7L65_06505 [Candidatus Bathyarchaeota archaeon]|nr:hypothetical protein [Candidatus Bathyarchaeota archaeon]
MKYCSNCGYNLAEKRMPTPPPAQPQYQPPPSKRFGIRLRRGRRPPEDHETKYETLLEALQQFKPGALRVIT